MNRFFRLVLAALVVLTWSACTAYLAFDQLLDYENRWRWLDWVMLLQFGIWALKMPLIIAIVCGVALALVWFSYWRRSERETRSSALMPMV